MFSVVSLPPCPPPHPPLRKHSCDPKSPGKTTVQRPPPCLDKAVLARNKAEHARDKRDSKARAGLKPYTKHGTMHKHQNKPRGGCKQSFAYEGGGGSEGWWVGGVRPPPPTPPQEMLSC